VSRFAATAFNFLACSQSLFLFGSRREVFFPGILAVWDMGAFALRSTLLALTVSVVTSLRCAPAHNTFTTQMAARHSAPRAASSPPTDFKQLAVYPLATAGEFAVIASLFKAIDTTVGVLPSFIVPPIFLFLSLRSRVFALLPAKRPPRGGFEGSATPKDVKRP